MTSKQKGLIESCTLDFFMYTEGLGQKAIRERLRQLITDYEKAKQDNLINKIKNYDYIAVFFWFIFLFLFIYFMKS